VITTSLLKLSINLKLLETN